MKMEEKFSKYSKRPTNTLLLWKDEVTTTGSDTPREIGHLTTTCTRYGPNTSSTVFVGK